MIATPIFLVICMHIKLTRLLEDSIPNAEYDLKGRFHGGYTNLDWGISVILGETLATNNENKNEVENSRAKN